MHRKLLTLLVSACALTAVMVGPATASAATLTLENGNGAPSEHIGFGYEPGATPSGFSPVTITNQFGVFECNRFSFITDVTQNSANPVTLSFLSQPEPYEIPTVSGCPAQGGAVPTYSNIQLTGPMTFNASALGTGTLPLRVTETWNGAITCVRQGTLNLGYTQGQDTTPGSGDDVYFSGNLTKVPGSSAFCPSTEHWEGAWAVMDTQTWDREWVVTP